MRVGVDPSKTPVPEIAGQHMGYGLAARFAFCFLFLQLSACTNERAIYRVTSFRHRYHRSPQHS